jgi:hypothetical protein
MKQSLWTPCVLCATVWLVAAPGNAHVQSCSSDLSIQQVSISGPVTKVVDNGPFGYTVIIRDSSTGCRVGGSVTDACTVGAQASATGSMRGPVNVDLDEDH